MLDDYDIFLSLSYIIGYGSMLFLDIKLALSERKPMDCPSIFDNLLSSTVYRLGTSNILSI